jgi:O-Antigen ligase
VLLAATIVAIAAGSSWSYRLQADASNLRWAALLALACVSLGLAVVLAPARAAAGRERRGAVLAAVFVGLCFVSAGWSVAPRLTVERAATVAVVLVIAGSLAFAAVRRPSVVAHVVQAILAAIAILLVGSLVLALADPRASVQTGPLRFRGVGEDPDTVPLIAAYALPLASWRFLEPARAVERWFAAAIAASALVLIGASGSRGALVAGAAGMFVFVAAELAHRPVRALAVGAAVFVTLGASLLITPLVSHLPGISTPAATAASRPGSGHGHHSPPGSPLAMDHELGRPLNGKIPATGHALFGSSGRVEAWRGAIGQADQRPLLGYGFGTEDRVFIDRWFYFAGARTESSFVGTYLMLGLVGLASLCLLLGWVVAGGVTALRRVPARGRAVAALGGVVAAGICEMLVQSYATSAGDIAMLTFWVAAALVALSPDWAAS